MDTKRAITRLGDFIEELWCESGFECEMPRERVDEALAQLTELEQAINGK